MKKLFLIGISVTMLLSLAGCSVRTEKYTDENGEVKKFSYVTKETENKFEGFETALKEKGIKFESENKADGIIEGAIEGRKYTLEDKRTFEIFRYDIKNEAYKSLAKTSKMYMEKFDAYIDAAVNDEYALIPGNDAEIKEVFMMLE